MENVENETIRYQDAIKKFNEEMIENIKGINKGYYLYLYFGNTKIKIVENIDIEKTKSNLTCGLIVVGVLIIFFILLFKFPFKTIMWTIVIVMVISALGNSVKK